MATINLHKLNWLESNIKDFKKETDDFYNVCQIHKKDSVKYLSIDKKKNNCTALILFTIVELIDAYDQSEEISSFKFKDSNYWFDKNTRRSLLRICTLIKKTDLIFEVNIKGKIYKVDTKYFLDFLDLLEIYSYKVNQTTAKHKANIMKCKRDEVFTYDFTKDYPERLVFDETKIIEE